MNVDVFLALVDEKIKLIQLIKTQMSSDVRDNKISKAALDAFSRAEQCIYAVKSKIRSTIYTDEEVFHLFWRAACNLGEFNANKPKKRGNNE